jgi:hypothetical protein
MRYISFVCFLLLIFFCGAKANAVKIGCTQQGSTFSTTSHGQHTAPELMIEIIYNQAASSFRTDAPEADIHFKTHFFPPVIAVSTKTLVRRLLPDVHAIVKLIIFPKHIFW